MLRRLFTVLSALSLLLWAATVVLWIRSYSVGDVLSRTTVARDKGRYDWAYAYLYSGAGALLVEEKSSAETGTFFFEGPHGEPGFSWRRIETPYTPVGIDGPAVDFEMWGFAWDRNCGELRQPDVLEGEHTTVFSRHLLVVPYWMAAALLAGLPVCRAVVAWKSYGRRRRNRRLCPSCGYDLRATPGRCPECGTPAAAKG